MKQQTIEKGAGTVARDLPLMLNANQAAVIMNATPKFVRDRCQDGTVRAVKVGRVWRINRDALLSQLGLEVM